MRLRFSLVLTVVLVGLLAGAASTAFAASNQTFVGYLMDVACGAGGKGADGSNTFTSPWDHTKGCAVVCKGSGYGLMIKVGDTYKLFKFDKAGSDLAFKQILNKTSRDKDLVVSVDGVLNGDMITVRAIKEANLL